MELELVCYIANGCIFKISTDEESKITNISCKQLHDDSWKDILKKKQDDEKETVCYELKQLDEKTQFVKIENLEERKKYEIRVETDQQMYKCLAQIHRKLFNLSR